MVLWRSMRPSRTNTQKRCPFHQRGLECKSRKSRDNCITGKFGLGVQSEAGQKLTVLSREHVSNSKYPFSETQEMTLHMDLSKWSILKLYWLCSLQLTHLKRPWCWEWLKAGEEEDDRGWDGWMASPTQWTGVWVNPRSRRWTGKPGVLQCTVSQRVWHDWATAVNWTQPLEGTVVPCSMAWPSPRSSPTTEARFFPASELKKVEGLPLHLLFNLGKRPTHSDRDSHHPFQSSYMIKQ